MTTRPPAFRNKRSPAAKAPPELSRARKGYWKNLYESDKPAPQKGGFRGPEPWHGVEEFSCPTVAEQKAKEMLERVPVWVSMFGVRWVRAEFFPAP